MKRNTTVRWLVLLAGLTAGLAQAAMTSNNTTNGWRTSGSGYGGVGQWTYMSQGNANQSAPFAANLCYYDVAVDGWKLYDYTNVDDPTRSTILHNGNVSEAANSMALAYTFQFTGTAYVTGSVSRTWYSSRLFAVLTSDNLSNGYDGSVASTLIDDTLGDNYGYDPVWSYTTYAIPVVAGQSLVVEWTWDHRDAWWVAGGNVNLTISEVPEPAALSLLALGGLVLFRRRR